MKLGLSLQALENMPREYRLKLLGKRMNYEAPARLGTDTIVPFDNEVPLLLAASICEHIRSDDRAQQLPTTPSYLLQEGTWKRLKDSDILVIGEDGKPSLNPDVFSIVKPEPATPLKPKRVLGD